MKAIKYLALSAVSVAVLALLSGCGKKEIKAAVTKKLREQLNVG